MSGYGTNDDFMGWLGAQCLTLPPGSPEPEALRQIGSDYLDAAYEYRLQCSRRAGGFDQERAWPRAGHFVHGEPVPDDLIPAAWIRASYRAAYICALNPGWATNTADPNRITRREQVDVISREFFAADQAKGGDSAPGMPSDAAINGMVQPWLCSASRSALFRVI